ncbi:Type 1 glutamine amidotransferase-like domain-containing protein [Candidatus Saccharibacteria bacterium]|nr:Type 1 glutamine amidotransferase-like domain-containing protein [Candidatus Saccharibacteria bacterium]
MKLLLTSNGLSNDSIAQAFAELIDKKPEKAKVAFIPTAANPERNNKKWLIDDLYRIKRLGYFVDIVELTAFKSRELTKILKPMDAIFVGGGNTFYLSYWMQQSGLFDMLPKFLKTKVYAGISAGSIIAGTSLLPSKAIKNGYIDEHYYEKSVPGEGSDKALKLVNIIFRPHLNSEFSPMVTEENLAKIAPKLDYPMYALDDNSALKIIDGNIEVISEDNWKLYENN